MIQVEFRDIHHRIKLSVPGVDDNDRYPLCFFCFQHLPGKLGRIALDIPVHADIQILPRYGLHTFFSPGCKLHTSCIGHSKNCSLRSLQYLLIFHFQTDNSLIVSTGKAQHLGGQRIVWIIPLIILIHLYSGKIIAPDPVSGFLFHIAFYLFNRGILLYPLTNIFLRQVKFPAQYLYDFIRFPDLVVNHGNRTYRFVICKHRSIGIENPPSGSLDHSFPFV